MGVFHCPVRPSSFPHLLPSPSWGLPCRARAMRLSIHAWLTLPVWIEHSQHAYLPVPPLLPGQQTLITAHFVFGWRTLWCWGVGWHVVAVYTCLSIAVILLCCIQSVGLWWCKKAQLCCRSPLMSCLGGSALQLSSVQTPCVLLCVQGHTTV